MVAYALAATGYPVHHANLNDGGVWVTNNSAGEMGRLNKPINQLDGDLYMGNVNAGERNSFNLDVVQQGSAVAWWDKSSAQLIPVDVSNMKVAKASEVNLPASASVGIGGGVLAVLDVANGDLWAMNFDPNQSLSRIEALDSSAKPLTNIGPQGAMAVAQNGTIFAVSAAKGLTRIAPDANGFTKPQSSPLTDATGTLAITTAGSTPIVLTTHNGVQDATVLIPGHNPVSVPNAANAVLQQAGPSTTDVLLATTSALISVPLSGGAARVAFSGGTGKAAAPVQSGGCVVSAWAGSPGAYATSCGGSALASRPIVQTSTDLAFRVNRNQLLLNDLTSGNVYNVDSGTPQQVANWNQIKPPTVQKPKNDKNNKGKTDANKPQPPKAYDVTLGARVGRTTALYVLDNDSDPTGGILSIASVSKPSSSDATLAISPDGQTVLITLAPQAGGDVTFTYVVGDGTNPTAQATVTVHTRTLSQNGPPQLRTGFKTHLWTVPVGGTISIPVLGDWRDYADGDPVVLKDAAANAGSITTTSDGMLAYTAPANPGQPTISYNVTDGMGAVVPGTLNVNVVGVGSPPVPATAEPDVVRGQVGQPIVINPLANDLPGSDPLDPTAVMKLAGSPASKPGITVTTDLAAGRITAVAHRPGTYALSYQVAYGNAAYGKGAIRVDVTPAASAVPITSPDSAALHGQAPVMVDVLANDFDPAGNLLVVQSATAQTANGQLQIAIVDGHWVRINALTLTLSPSTQLVTYTVTDGVTGSVTGQITVTQLPAPARDTPVPQPDYATVRAGDVTTIPVLDNDISPGGDPITLVSNVSGAPAAGQLTVTPNIGAAYVSGNVVRYLAPAAATITKPTQVTIDYYAQDPAGDSARGQAHVTITPPPNATTNPDQPPAPQPVDARTVAGDTITIKIPTSGSDPDGDSVTVTGIGSAPKLGRVLSIGGSSITYQAFPSATNGGTDTFTYLVTDSYGLTGPPASIRVAVVPPGQPQPPVAVNDSVTVAPGATVAVDPLANDLIAPDDNVTIQPLAASNPGLGADVARLSSPKGPIVVKANPNNGKPVVVLYRITDGLNSSSASITVRSQPGIDLPPVAFDQFAQPKPNATQVSVDVLKGDSDPDGDSTALSIISPAGAVGGKLTLTLTKVPHVIPYVIKDSGGATAMALIYVPAVGAGAPFAKSGTSISIPVGGSKSVNIADYVTDPAGKAVRLTTTDQIFAAPSAGLKAVSQGGSKLVLTGLGSYAGPAAVTFQVTDGTSLTDPAGLSAMITVPVQIGSATPVLRCPSTVFDVVEGGAAVPIDVASVCHVWTADPAQLASMTYSGAWKKQPSGVDLSGSGSATLSVKAGGAAKPGDTGAITVGVSGSSAAVASQLFVRIIKAPRPVMAPIVVDGVKAGDTKQFDLTGYVSSQLGDPVISVVGTPTETSGDKATVSAHGASVTISPDKDSKGTMTFAVTVTDVADTTRTDREVTGQITLHVLGHPDAPTNVVPGRSVLSHSVELSWTAPANNGAPITYYQVAYSGGSQKCPASPCTITGLTNGQNYAFTVTAYNLVSAGPPSAQSPSARPNAVPDAVTGFTTSNPQDGALTVSWTPAHVDGTAVLKYQISWPGGGSATATGTATTAHATGLTNDNQTTFTIVAVNALGGGPTQTATGQSAGKPLPNPPVAPTFTATTDATGNTRAVTVSWQAEDPNGAGPVVYTVNRTDGHGGAKVVCTGVTTTSCTDDGLANDGTKYTYTVTAANAAAKLDPAAHTSSPSPGTTMEATSTPDPITGIATHVLASTPDGQVPVTFNLGASHGASSSVKCTYSGGGCGSQGSFPVSGQNGASMTLSFPASWSGNFTLSNCNGSTQSDSYAGQACNGGTTSQGKANGPPFPPNGLACSSDNGTSAQWNWSAPQDNGGGIDHYNISNAGSGTTGSTSYTNSSVAFDGQQHTLGVQSVDTRGEVSSVASAACLDPVPQVSVGKGSATSATTYCVNSGRPGYGTCYWIDVYIHGSPGQSLTVWYDTDCNTLSATQKSACSGGTNGGELHYASETISLDGSGNWNEVDNSKGDNRAFGYNGAMVWVDLTPTGATSSKVQF